MSTQAAAQFPSSDESAPRSASSNEESSVGVAERLKEEFGDYSDPMSYDWTWRETD